MNTPKNPKIIRLEKMYPGIISFTDKLLDEGLSNRRIATKIKKEYNIPISRESIRGYRAFRESVMSTVVNHGNTSSQEQSYHICIRPYNKKKRRSWQDDMIARAIS
jgi:hypothetical protein